MITGHLINQIVNFLTIVVKCAYKNTLVEVLKFSSLLYKPLRKAAFKCGFFLLNNLNKLYFKTNYTAYISTNLIFKS